MPLVDTIDIGKSAAACLVSDPDQHHTIAYEIAGPELLNGEMIAAKISEAIGKPVKWNEVKQENFKNMPQAFAEIFNYMIEKGKTSVPFPGHVKELTGQNTDFSNWLQRNKDIFE
jgi:hypothetical protein